MMKQKRVSMDSIAITLEKIEKRYGEKQVIDKLSYLFLAGSRTVIAAPSGVGKTTLLRLILGLEALDRGQIWYEKKLQASVVFQEDRLFDYASALENIRAVLPNKKISDTKICEELSRVGLLEDAYRRVSLLSGGMKRRVALVRAVLMPGNLLVLDEPFKGLDRERKQQVMAYIKEKIEGRTFLLVTHEREEAAYFGADILELGKRDCCG